MCIYSIRYCRLIGIAFIIIGLVFLPLYAAGGNDAADSSGTFIPPEDVLYHLASGLRVNLGFSYSHWVTSLAGPFTVNTFGNQMLLFELSYSKPLITLGETLGMFHRPHLSVQTDFGLTTRPDLTTFAEPSNIYPNNNLKLLAQVNPIEWIVCRYRAEVFVAEVSCEENFIYSPYHGESQEISAGTDLLLVSKFHDFEIGLSGNPDRDEDLLVEVGAYHALWERPRYYGQGEDIFGNALPQVYHGQQDFWGIFFNSTGIGYRKDRYGQEVEAYRGGYYFRSGSGDLRLSSELNQTSEDGEGLKYYGWELGIFFRYYLPLLKDYDLGIDFHYNYRDVNHNYFQDQTIFLTAMVSFLP